MREKDAEQLENLTEDQRAAVKNAFKEWVQISHEEGYAPLTDWKNFHPEVDHSALLNRLLSGKRAFKFRPHISYSYPDYGTMEKYESPLQDFTQY